MFGIRFLKPILLARMLHKCMNSDVELMRHAKMMLLSKKKRLKEDRLYDFLAGLDPSLDQVRSQVLAQDPLPSVRNAFAFVRCEELRQATMMANGLFRRRELKQRGIILDPKAHHISTGSQASIPSQVDQSTQQVSLANASTSSGNTGNFGFTESTTSVPCNKPWIIDLGASNHMTNDSKLFTLYTTTPRNTVKDILTKKLIGLGRERGGLYYLDLKEALVLEAGHVYQVGTEESKVREKIWLWHRRSRHPSFQYL
uniref:Uncharacterized protein n=1 Tax=Fagus sylvatica TaxID=28930 RepID=A0A2N9FDB1_FAGSY